MNKALKQELKRIERKNTEPSKDGENKGKSRQTEEKGAGVSHVYVSPEWITDQRSEWPRGHLSAPLTLLQEEPHPHTHTQQNDSTTQQCKDMTQHRSSFNMLLFWNQWMGFCWVTDSLNSALSWSFEDSFKHSCELSILHTGRRTQEKCCTTVCGNTVNQLVWLHTFDLYSSLPLDGSISWYAGALNCLS